MCQYIVNSMKYLRRMEPPELNSDAFLQHLDHLHVTYDTCKTRFQLMRVFVRLATRVFHDKIRLYYIWRHLHVKLIFQNKVYVLKIHDGAVQSEKSFGLEILTQSLYWKIMISCQMINHLYTLGKRKFHHHQIIEHYIEISLKARMKIQV